MNTYKEVNGIAKLGKTLATLTVLAIVAIGVGLLVAWYMGRNGSIGVVAPPVPTAGPS